MWYSQKKLEILFRSAAASSSSNNDEPPPTPPTPKHRPFGKQQKTTDDTTVKNTGSKIYHIECTTRHFIVLSRNEDESRDTYIPIRFFVAINSNRTRVRFFKHPSNTIHYTLAQFLGNNTQYNDFILKFDNAIEHDYSVWEDMQRDRNILYQKILRRTTETHSREVSEINIIEEDDITNTHALWQAVFPQPPVDEIEED